MNSRELFGVLGLFLGIISSLYLTREGNIRDIYSHGDFEVSPLAVIFTTIITAGYSVVIPRLSRDLSLFWALYFAGAVGYVFVEVSWLTTFPMNLAQILTFVATRDFLISPQKYIPTDDKVSQRRYLRD